jgi:hypothetical protein
VPDAPTTYPLDPASVSGTNITADILLNEPTRINRFMTDYLNVNRRRFLLDVIFDNGGGVSGGAIIYERQGLNDFFATRDVQEVAPGAAFPLVPFARQDVAMASPRKWGGEYEMTYEARDRNNSLRTIGRYNVQLANTIIRKINIAAMVELEAAIASLSGAGVITGHNWTTAIPNGSSPTAPGLTPIADLAQVIETNELRELGIVYDTLIISPQDMTILRLFYGDALSKVLEDYGFDTLFVTAQVAAGTVYAVAGRGQVGQYRVEAPLRTVSVEQELLEKFTVKTSVRPAIFVDNPYAVLKITGVRG